MIDGLGSVRQLSDASGAIVQSYTYAPFGELLAAQGNRSSALQYTGEQKDIDTGLIYLRARWYDSTSGRFTTRDPFPGFADVPQTLHPYIYALNNPINLKDPSGELVENPWDLFVLLIDAVIYLIDAINPALDDCTRAQLLLIDLAALGIDGAALLFPGAPGGAGLAGRVFGQGTRVLVQGGVRVAQIGVRGAQVGTHASAMTKGGSRGTRGSVGSGSSGGSGGKYSFPGPDALAKKLGVSREEFHKTIKPAMKRDFWREMKAIGSTNPDIGIDIAGNIVLKHPTTGKTIETGVSLISYGR